MKNPTVALAVLLSLFGLVPSVALSDEGYRLPAASRASGPMPVYVSVAGYSFAPHDDRYRTGSDYGVSADMDFDSGQGASLAIGWAPALVGPRAEVELGLRKVDVDRLTKVNKGPDQSPGGELSTLTLMGNGLYVFDTGTRFRPYAGAGLGFARHDLSLGSIKRAGEDDVPAVDGENGYGIAWQTFAGLGLAVSPRVEARIGWRYLGGLDTKIGKSKVGYHTQNVELGLLAMF